MEIVTPQLRLLKYYEIRAGKTNKNSIKSLENTNYSFDKVEKNCEVENIRDLYKGISEHAKAIQGRANARAKRKLCSSRSNPS